MLLRWGRPQWRPANGRLALRAAIGLLALIGLAILILGPLPASAQADGPHEPPVIPDQPTATAIYEGMVDLEWNDVPGAASYDVQAFRSDWFDLPGNSISIAFYGPGAIIKGLIPESRYYFRVRANNALGSSDWSEHRLANPTGGDFGNWDGVPEPSNRRATGAPTISGTVQVDETLTADLSGVVDENGLDRVKFHYQWISRDGGTDSNIERATSPTYTLRTEDQGKSVRVRVSFTDRGGFEETLTSEATSALNGPATGAPTISGAPRVGKTLTADTSGIADANGLDNATFSYQWVRNDGTTEADIQDATNSTYTLSADDQGKTIKVLVSFTDSDGFAETLTSAATSVVEPPNSSPTGALTIIGTPRVGKTLTADSSGIADSNGLDNATFSYQWISRDGDGDSNIEGARSSTHTLRTEDQGKTIKVLVSFTDSDGFAETLTSAATSVVEPPNSSPTGAPTINGGPGRGGYLVGQTLTADTSGIADSNGLDNATFSYQWISRDGSMDSNIEGATGSTYTLRTEDKGKSIRVRVSFTDSDGFQETLTSVATSVVTPPNSPATGVPTISGTPRVGKTLTADSSGIADADGLDNVTFSYQWVRGNRWKEKSDIEGATGSTYTLVSDDQGKNISVRVSFTDDWGNPETLISTRAASIWPACPGGENVVTPTAVEVGAVPIVVDSTTAEYFVLYVRPDLDLDREIPVSVTLGQEGATTLTEQLPTLPKEHYRVEKFLIADPGDVDFDCIGDIAELQDPVGMNPLNPAPAVPFIEGAVAIPDRETFEALSYKGYLTIDAHLTDLEFVKFYILGMHTNRPVIYFINSQTHQIHYNFRVAIAPWYEPLWPRYALAMKGVIVYHPNVVAPDGSLGVYRYEFWPRGYSDIYSFEDVAYSYELLAASMPLLDNNLAYYPRHWRALHAYHEERALFNDSRINVLFEEDIMPDVEFVPLNMEEAYGFLRNMSLEERPNPRDIVIYETLPNELSRVAGIITTVPQTPLSHVNLRAVQDGVPNAFIRDFLDDDDLIGSYVHYTVAEDGWTLRAATPAEVDAHYAASRPSRTQTPERDLTFTTITALGDIEFDDWDAFGVKAANVAVLSTLGFPDGTVPSGFAVPFYFYDEFMKHNGFYDDVEEMLDDPDFQSNYDTQEDELKKLRKKIKKGGTPEWMTAALEEMHAAFPEGASLRYRSSTNNEDLPGFSGAGLYDSKTQHPEETVEDGIAKSLKQVYASLWNFRAFTEREFHRIDHLAAAMGVLVHPNYSDELANGVAVSFDPFYGTGGYYVNTQLGEDLVTNPDALSVPEEVLLHRQKITYSVLATSNQVPDGRLLMSDDQMYQLRVYLGIIHKRFADLYGVEAGEPFAMETEFKITSDNVLAIKQARPWVFSEAAVAEIPPDNSPATGAPAIYSTPQVGRPLRADTSLIADEDGLANAVFHYQWITNDGTADTEIAGATGVFYTPIAADVGKAVKVTVSFTDDEGNPETLTSAPTAEVVMPPLTANHSEPAPHDGQTAFTFTLWFSEEFKLSYLTLRDHAFTVEGGTVTRARRGQKPSNMLWEIHVQPDSDAAVTIVLPATVDCDSEEAICTEDGRPLSNRLEFTVAGPVEPAPNSSATGAPAISGIVRVGEELTADATDIADEDGLDNVVFSYQWVRSDGNGGTNIQDATGSSYTLVEADEGKTVKVTVSFTDAEGNPETLTSDPTGAVEPKPNSSATGLPTISGPEQVGETLTADTSGITDDDGLDNAVFAYQWLRGDAEIAGATGSSYTLVKADEGQTVKVTVSFTDEAGHAESLTSDPTRPVEATPNTRATGAPTIDGIARVGETLTADTSGIDDDDGLDSAAFSYQWLPGDAEISGATGDTYTLVEADEGRTIKVKVSFTDGRGNPETLTSDPTGAVAAAETVPGRPQDLEGNASAQGIALTWKAPEGSTVTSYVIYRAELDDGQIHGKPMTQHATIGATGAEMAYTDAGVEEGVEYRYRVAAVNSAGEGKKSNWLDIAAGDSPP